MATLSSDARARLQALVKQGDKLVRAEVAADAKLAADCERLRSEFERRQARVERYQRAVAAAVAQGVAEAIVTARNKLASELPGWARAKADYFECLARSRRGSAPRTDPQGQVRAHLALWEAEAKRLAKG
jgi:hypothetical protein